MPYLINLSLLNEMDSANAKPAERLQVLALIAIAERLERLVALQEKLPWGNRQQTNPIIGGKR